MPGPTAAQKKSRAIAKGSTRLLLGQKELDAKLRHLKLAGANKIARKALSKALTLALRAMKQKVPPQYKEAKRVLGKRMDRKGGPGKDQHRAKVGAAVGKAFAVVGEERTGGVNRGVGIGGRTIHWFILGTKHMRPVLADVVKGGFAAAKGAIDAVIRLTVRTELAKEAKKK